jgi:rRNA maturation protein Nop10
VIAKGNRCPNFNHSRTNAPVRCCPQCGKVVNENIPIKNCTQDEHAKSRRERDKFCLYCGEQLIK